MTKTPSEITLVVSDESEPPVKLAPGERLKVVSVALINAERAPASAVAARLCSGGGTCVALVKVDE